MNKRPNILFIVSDQHSPKFLGFDGNDDVNTPNIDQLARKGINFSNAYCQNPLCAPSRASILTGQYSKNVGIYDNMHVLESNSLTFPRLLSQSGYRTCLIGKSHLNGEQFQGYQQRPYGDLFGQGHQPDPQRLPKFGINGLGDVLGNNGASEIPEPLTQTEICVSESTKWLQTHKALHPDQPFLLSVHFDKPHFPIRPPQRFLDRYKGKVKLPDVPEGYLEKAVPFISKAIANNETGHHYGKDFDTQLAALESYYGCVEWVDDAIGRIVQTLDYLGYKDDTLVIYSSDHGEMGGEKGTWQKTLFFEPSARVPLVMRFGNQLEAGAIRESIVGLLDIFPTLCDLTGIDIPEQCDGTSLVPELRGSKIERDHVFCESAVLRATENAGCMLRTGNWKYCYYLDGNEELYDLSQDPDEWKNLSAYPEFEDVKSKLREQTVAFWEPDDYLKRLAAQPIMSKEKHFYEFSNQFMLGDGVVVDARP